MITYSAQAIANFFIAKSLDTGEELTPMKLLKLIYVAHGWYLGLFKKPLISEPIVAWSFGPVIESIYHQYKKYGNKQIKRAEGESNIDPKKDDVIEPFLDRIWQVYSPYTGIQLSNLTHEKNTPWDQVWDEVKKDTVIPNALIQTYYETEMIDI